MTDTHTHILPGMDDGAPDVNTALRMLRMEREQGVAAVALTPHYYSDEESVEAFLRRREASLSMLEDAISLLPEAERIRLPRRIVGAEVAWSPHMEQWQRLGELCYGGSGYLLVELPFSAWNGELFRGLYALMERTGVTPVVAHIDRYWGRVDRGAMEELLSMGLPVQLSAAAVTDWRTRGAALRLLRRRKAQLLISDAHGDRERAPDIGAALEVIRRRDAALCAAVRSFRLV